MRILTPIEQREIERLKNLILADKIDRIEFQASFGASEDKIFHLPEERELWLNLLDMVLQTNAAMQNEWRKRY